MKRVVVIESAHKNDGSPGVWFRFVCSACKVEGAWHPSLNDAETSAARHNRTKHTEEARA